MRLSSCRQFGSNPRSCSAIGGKYGNLLLRLPENREPARINWSHAFGWAVTFDRNDQPGEIRQASPMARQRQSDILIIPHRQPTPQVFRRSIRPHRRIHFTIAYTLGDAPGHHRTAGSRTDESVKLQLRQRPATAPAMQVNHGSPAKFILSATAKPHGPFPASIPDEQTFH